jgi:hypothetical protein
MRKTQLAWAASKCLRYWQKRKSKAFRHYEPQAWVI